MTIQQSIENQVIGMGRSRSNRDNTVLHQIKGMAQVLACVSHLRKRGN